ncbi:MAG: hypothetical protein M3Y78_14040 [Pseudomonadota bacterium]|nr:hypothetical protein [Pseudomonadota bacterium]
MQIELNSLYWPNIDPEIVRIHRKCFEHIGVPVRYTEERVRHGQWMDRVIAERLDRDGIVGFIDIDALAYSRAAVEDAFRYVDLTQSFLGIAQSSNHLQIRTHIFAAPAFLVISKQAYDTLGRPSMMPKKKGWDVAQNLSMRADALGFPYRVLYPTGFREILPDGTVWRLGNYGHFGIGTDFDGGFFHNFLGRDGRVDILSQVANSIVADIGQPTTLPYMSRDDKLWMEGMAKPWPRPESRLDKLLLSLRRAFAR